MLLFSHQVISNFWRSHGLQYASFPCPSLSLRVCSDSCPLSWWCHPTISLVFLPSIFPSIRVFSNESTLLIRLPKYWSFNFSISPSKEYSELISFRIDWFDLCCPRDSQRVFSTTIGKHEVFGAQLSLWSNSHICTWPLKRNHNFDYTGSFHYEEYWRWSWLKRIENRL